MDFSLSKETNNDTDIITEGIKSPRCASILYDCFKNLESKVNEIYELSSSTKDAQIKVSESSKFINEKFGEYEVDRKQKEKEIAELKEDLAALKETFDKFARYKIRNRIFKTKKKLKGKM